MARKPDVQYIRYYVDGTAAKKLEPAVRPVSDAPTIRMPAIRKKVKRKVIFVDPVALAGMAVAVCMLVCMIVSFVQLRAVRQEADVMERYVSQQLQENADLSKKYTLGYNLYEVEQTALALGLVPSDSVPQTQILLPAAEPEVPATVWEQIGAFFTDLFA